MHSKQDFVEGILKVLSEAGSGFDIVSGGELDRVLKIGADPKKIVFSGVGKQVEILITRFFNNRQTEGCRVVAVKVILARNTGGSVNDGQRW